MWQLGYIFLTWQNMASVGLGSLLPSATENQEEVEEKTEPNYERWIYI
jgi:hypothetical protein